MSQGGGAFPYLECTTQRMSILTKKHFRRFACVEYGNRSPGRRIRFLIDSAVELGVAAELSNVDLVVVETCGFDGDDESKSKLRASRAECRLSEHDELSATSCCGSLRGCHTSRVTQLLLTAPL